MTDHSPGYELVQRDNPPERLFLKGGRVVQTHGVELANVLIELGRIVAVSPDLKEAGVDAEVIDVTGKHLLPGAIDLHVHFRDPLASNDAEDLASGSRAAASGGVIGFADMPNTDPPTITPQALADKKALAADKCVIDYAFYPTLGNAPYETLTQYDPTSIPGFKAYMGGTTRADAMTDEDLDATFKAGAELGVPVTVHSEDDSIIETNMGRFGDELDDPAVHAKIRDVACCVASTRKAIDIAKRHNAWLHVAHLTTAEEVSIIEQAQADGVRVTAEVTLHHLLLCDEDYERLGHFLKCNPSVKSARDRTALRDGLRRGIISFIATDHAPHPKQSKTLPYDLAPSGCVSVEFYLPLLLNEVNAGRMSLPELAVWTSDEVAEMFGIERKGRIEAGYDADIVVCDLEATRTITPESIRSACGHSLWEGATLKGWPELTLLRGVPVFAPDIDVPFRPARPLRFRQSRPGKP